MNIKRSVLYLALIAVLLLSLGAGLAPRSIWPYWRMVNEPLHSAIEAGGAMAAVIMALILLLRGREEGDWNSTALAAGFLGMGILDGLHAGTTVGHGFVLLHSFAVLAGGIGFGLVWFPGLADKRTPTALVPLAFAALCALAGIWILFYRDNTLLMVQDGEFTNAARAINIAGGVLSLSAAGRFLIDFQRSGDIEDYLFACLALIFGLAGVTFNYSALWDNVWWFWHFERLAAYAIVVSWVVYRHAQGVRELKAALDAKHRAEEERLSFFNMLTHDMRSPLTVISGYADFLKPGMPREEFSSIVAGIGNACGRMSLLIEDMLALSRLELGKAVLNFEPLSLRELVDQAVADNELQAQEMDLGLDVEVADGLPEVYADKTQLLRALVNLVANAVNYNKMHGKVSVRAGWEAEGEGAVYVEVADTGLGIPNDEIPHVFDSYYRSRKSRAKRGTGLGLAIVKAVVEAHGGAVHAKSTENEGSSFRVSLPVNPTNGRQNGGVHE